MINYQVTQPVKIGLVGTGYAAKKRAEAFKSSKYAELIAVSGHKIEDTQTFAEKYQIKAVNSWHDLINNLNVDLICISNFNQDHSLITHTALKANKHVIVEYPLAFSPSEAEDLIKLAETRDRLLHVEHIEILGGVHQAIRQYLPEIGDPFLANYTTIAPKNPAPCNWKFHYHQYGFPLIAALSRIHRFTDLFGEVENVSCQTRFWDAPERHYFLSCLCQAQLTFKNNLLVNIIYGKGEIFTERNRTWELYGNRGKLLFEGEKGYLIKDNQTISIEVAPRKGLFAKDTEMVLAHLFEKEPLYINNNSSLYALKIADAAFKASQNKIAIAL